MDGIFTRMIELPSKVRSFVVAHSDQTYTIVLNSKLSYEQHLLSYQHELEHIKNGDYDKKCSADMIELTAHAPAAPPKPPDSATATKEEKMAAYEKYLDEREKAEDKSQASGS